MAARYLIYLPLRGNAALVPIYVGGVFLKGLIWGFAYKAKNPTCSRWIYRPFMSLFSTFLFAMLLPYSALTIRRHVWARGGGVPPASSAVPAARDQRRRQPALLTAAAADRR